MTYQSSIAIANVCLAPVDEETSSAAQDMGSDAGRQWERGIILRAPNYPRLRTLGEIPPVDHKQETQMQWLV